MRVFTHLTREATPVIRHWSRDTRVSPASAASAAGRTFVPSAAVVGRHDDLVVFKGAKFYPSQVETVVRSFPELSDEFRIEVIGGGGALVGRCTVVSERREESPEIEQRLVRALREELGVTPSLRLKHYGALERSTFKAQRLVRL